MKFINKLKLQISVRFAVSIICILWLAASAGRGQTSTPSLAASTKKLFIIAHNRDGKRIQGLQPSDMSILDNGSSATVLAVEPADAIPVRLGILLYSERETFKMQLDATTQLLGKLRPEVDQAFVVTQAAVDNAHAWPDDSTARPWPTSQVVWTNLQDVVAFSRTLQWDTAIGRASELAAKMFATDPEKQFRRIIVQFRNPAAESMVEWGSAPYKQLEERQMNEIAEYQRENVTVFTIGLPSPLSRAFNAPPSETMSRGNAQYLAYKAGESRMDRISGMTGGRYFSGDPNFKSYLNAIEADLQCQLLLTFATTANLNGATPHKLEIHTNRKDLKVNSQNQYFPVNP